MRVCEFCGASLPNHAAFCRDCGRPPRRTSPHSTQKAGTGKLQAQSSVHSSSNDDQATKLSNDDELQTILHQETGSLHNTVQEDSLEDDMDDHPIHYETVLDLDNDYLDHPTLHAPDDYLDRPTQQTFPSSNTDEDQPTLLTDQPTLLTDQSTLLMDQPTLLTDQPTLLKERAAFDSLTDEEDEEEERKGLIGIPLFDGSGPAQRGAPVVSRAPRLQGAPTVTPSPLYPPAAPPIYLPRGLSTQGGTLPGASTPPAPYQPGTGSGPKKPPRPAPGGCSLWMILVFIPLLILAGLFGVGFTILAPALSLSGGTSVAQGGKFHLHGTNFVPHLNITLTRDDGISLQVVQAPSPIRRVHQAAVQTSILEEQLVNAQTDTASLTASDRGTFDATIIVGSDWRPGLHRIQANEGLTPRSASLSITVTGDGTTPTPTATPTVTPTASATATPTPTPQPTSTPTPIPDALSGVTPNIVNLGPIGEGSSQTVSSQVTLTTTGTNLIQWTASWDQQKSPWLQLDQTSGQIQAPNSQQVTVSAQGSTLAAGKYQTVVTFTNTANQQSVTLSISLTVQQGCIGVSPNMLQFTGVENTRDDSPQSLLITNCGQQMNTWNVSSSDATVNWLDVNPRSGTLNAGATQNVIVTATNIKAKLKAGSYQVQLTFANGSSQVTVTVKLTVQPAPQLQVSPTALSNGSTQCAIDRQQNWICSVTLTNLSRIASLPWTASSNGIAGIKFTDTAGNTLSNGTIPPGTSLVIKISIPSTVNSCQVATTFIFTGPANTVTVPWTCTIIG
ncbi:BACON domain-containing protein [Tengunoibacter tsumagoiensis]|uniref:BACON domain-containing protein n=1 Tax=Tengunoibacter tsumagoiensis TaxID=2014871 RepID=A0A402A0P3_9CHLR|nr:hypothetical protein [Tengunoibacter tsumagoiensis]GCE12626.1 hypothetical protein KTT_24850 [Tengunoibacter tsumagoiensis]